MNFSQIREHFNNIRPFFDITKFVIYKNQRLVFFGASSCCFSSKESEGVDWGGGERTQVGPQPTNVACKRWRTSRGLSARPWQSDLAMVRHPRCHFWISQKKEGTKGKRSVIRNLWRCVVMWSLVSRKHGSYLFSQAKGRQGLAINPQTYGLSNQYEYFDCKKLSVSAHNYSTCLGPQQK